MLVKLPSERSEGKASSADNNAVVCHKYDVFVKDALFDFKLPIVH